MYLRALPKLLLLLFIIQIRSIRAKDEILLIETFDASNTTDWDTLDGSDKNIWGIKGGMFIQPIIDANDGKETRCLAIRKEVIGYDNVENTVNIYLDILPLTNNNPESFWHGIGLFCGGNTAPCIIVALRKELDNNLSGLHVFYNNQWHCGKGNLNFTAMKKYKLRIFLEKDTKESFLSVHARAWPVCEQEPDYWMIKENIPEANLGKSANSLFLGTGVQWGKKSIPAEAYLNPRAAYDNLFIFSGLVKWEGSQSAGDLSEIIGHLFDEDQYKKDLPITDDELVSRVDQIGIPYPNYGGYDRLLFLEMLAMRNLSLWEEAREIANQITLLFPRSPFASCMGGKEGKTEEQAAKEFSESMKLYHDRSYPEARNGFLKFLEGYPRNWRKDHCRYLAADCLYQDRKEDEFINEVNELINGEPIGSPYHEKLIYMHAAILVRNKKGADARDLLDYLEAQFPQSRLKQKGDIPQLRLESYLYGRNIDDITSATKNLGDIIQLYGQQLNRSRDIGRWYTKNVRMGLDLFDKIDQFQNADQLIADEVYQLAKDDTRVNSYLSVSEIYAQRLVKKSKIDEAINFLGDVLNRCQKPCRERNFLLKLAARLYMEKGNGEKTDILIKQVSE